MSTFWKGAEELTSSLEAISSRGKYIPLVSQNLPIWLA